MKIIFKIIEYLPDTNQIVVKFARQNAPKPIDEYSPVAIGCSTIDTLDNINFIESICNRGKHLVEQQEKEELVLNKNICEEIEGTRFEDYVGKVVGTDISNLPKFKSRKLKRIDIE